MPWHVCDPTSCAPCHPQRSREIRSKSNDALFAGPDVSSELRGIVSESWWRSPHDGQRVFVIAPKIHAGNLAKTVVRGLVIPTRIRIDLKQRHPLLVHIANPSDPADVRIDLFPVDRHERKQPIGRPQKLLQARHTDSRFLWHPLPSLPERGFDELAVRMGYLQLTYVTQAETLEAIEPNVSADQRQQEPSRAQREHVAVDRISLERAPELNQLPAPDCRFETS